MRSGRTIGFYLIEEPSVAVRRIVAVRFSEALELQSALCGNDDDAIHAFRLACKRLRYALQHFEQTRHLTAAEKTLDELTGALGDAHDCVLLMKRARRCAAKALFRRARRERDDAVVRARRIWKQALTPGAAFASLAEYAGFTSLSLPRSNGSI